MPEVQIRTLWTRLPASQEAQDERSWASAARESGHPLRVLWGEIVELIYDLNPRRVR